LGILGGGWGSYLLARLDAALAGKAPFEPGSESTISSPLDPTQASDKQQVAASCRPNTVCTSQQKPSGAMPAIVRSATATREFPPAGNLPESGQDSAGKQTVIADLTSVALGATTTVKARSSEID